MLALMLALVLTLVPAALTPALAQRPAAAATPSTLPRLGDCNASSHQTLLQPAPAAAVPLLAEARGLWLDDRRLRWPGRSAAPGTRFRLLHAADGQIIPAPGAPALDAEGALTLDVFEGRLPDSVRQRFDWAGDGVTLTVRPADAPRLPLLLRRQLVLVHEDSAGRVLQATALQTAGALDALYRPAADVPDLGATVLRRDGELRTGFKLWAPTAERVALCLYDRSSGPAAQIVPMTREGATGVWQAQRPGDLSGRYYTYLVDVHVRGTGRVRNLVTDPYALSLGADSRRGYIADLDSATLKPEGWDSTPRPPPLADNAEMVIYALHLRDFSIGDTTVPAAQRGTYGAFTATDSGGMRHLRALKAAGLTDVHLMPVFDGAAVPDQGCVTPGRDCFNRGHAPLHFTAPEGSFASDAADGAVRIREFRRMVQALHRQGLRVGMDVAYNHTTASGQHARSVLDRIVPGYYQRLDAAGTVQTSTCCAPTATEHRMMAKLMIDSAVVWARDHRIDSFRFDRMGHQPKAAMLQLQSKVDLAAGRRVRLIGEGWNFGEVADGARFEQASQRALPGSGIATFSDRARDAIRGAVHGGSAGDNGLAQTVNPGWISGLHVAPNAQAGAQPQPAARDDLLRAADLVRVGLAGTLRDYEMEDHRGQRVTLAQIPYGNQPAGYAAAPGEVVNFVENPGNPTLFDALAVKLPAGTSGEDRARVQTLGTALVLFSQGVAYLHAGQEMLSSKSLDRNAEPHIAPDIAPHRAPLAVGPDIKPAPEHIGFARDAALDLLRIRASSTLFRLRTADEVRRRLNFHHTGPAQSGTLVVGRLSGMDHPGAGFVEMLYVVNVSPEAQTVPLPELRGRAYVLHPVHRAATAADKRPREATWDVETGTLTVPPRTALVYVLEGS